MVRYVKKVVTWHLSQNQAFKNYISRVCHWVLLQEDTLDHVVLDKAKEWDLGFEFDFAIGMNGGELYDARTKKIDKYYLLPSKDIKEILTFLKPFDLNAIIYVNAYQEIRCLRIDDFMKDSIKRKTAPMSLQEILTTCQNFQLEK